MRAGAYVEFRCPDGHTRTGFNAGFIGIADRRCPRCHQPYEPADPDLGLVAETVTVTPETARAWLATGLPEDSEHRRLIDPRRVHGYARRMAGGEWRDTARRRHPLVFDADGQLQAGIMRLHAIVEAGVPVSMVVERYVHRGAEES